MNNIKIYDLIVIGGGASGFFGALHCKLFGPQKSVAILEMQSRFLSKVAISGGGRCNVTHQCFDIPELIKNYPRGAKELPSVFARFQPKDTIEWFESRGVPLKTEADGRVFPVSNQSSSIIDCLMAEAEYLGVELYNSVKVAELEREEDIYIVKTNRQTFHSKNILLATGGISKTGLSLIKNGSVDLVEPVPSLFSFHIPDTDLQKLAGISLLNAGVKMPDNKTIYEGPLLITHQGISGPATLKASAFEARNLYIRDYQFQIAIHWVTKKEHEVREWLMNYKSEHPIQKVYNSKLFDLPARLTEYILQKVGISDQLKWADIPNKSLNKLVETFINDIYMVNGKSPNKEEFVTAGGIQLSEIDFKTMQIKNHPGLYATGELLDIDGITGGFNFQAAWSTGYVAGKAIGEG